MAITIITREQVCERLQVSPELLLRYETRGLVRVVREGDAIGYEPSDVRRVWSIVSLHRDLGINLAGVEAILRLRSQLDELHGHLADLALKLAEALESDHEPRA